MKDAGRSLLTRAFPSQVKEALDSLSLRRVAIKIVNLRQLRKVRNGEVNPEESVRKELSIHRKLKHQNVVELIEQASRIPSLLSSPSAQHAGSSSSRPPKPTDMCGRLKLVR